MSEIKSDKYLITIKQFCEKHSWPTEAALRALYHRAKKNKSGVVKAFVKFGKRLLINDEIFFKEMRSGD